MALTMTRTRTQTALTKLAQLVANVHGELEYVERLIVELPEHRETLAARREQLVADRDSLYLTLKQFDAELALDEIGVSDEWSRQYGRRRKFPSTVRYLKALHCLGLPCP